MKIFITGALGFIGSTLTTRYRADGHEVVGVDQNATGETGVVAGDTSLVGEWQAHTVGCDVLIHTAALVTNTAPMHRCWEVNVLGTRHAIDAAVDAGVTRFVHFSSVRAFSDVDFPDGVDETHPVRPDGHSYVDTKIASEQVALQAHAAREIEVTVIRPGDVYGPGSLPWTLWPVSGLLTGTFGLPSEGGVFSPVYVDNLVDAVVIAALTPDAAGQVITISDGIGVDNHDFFGRYGDMVGMQVPSMPADALRTVFADAGAGADTVDYFLRKGTYSNAKARTLLSWRPEIDLDEGMRRTERWLREIELIR